MSRCNPIIAAALAAAALAAPTALAQAPDIHAGLSEPVAEGQSKQDLRMPDTREAARAATDDNVTDAVERALAQERYYESFGRQTTDDNVITPKDRALAQERYYSSYGKAAPPTIATRTVAANPGDGIARLHYLSAVFGALIVGLGAGSGLHLLHVRRRYRTGPVT